MFPTIVLFYVLLLRVLKNGDDDDDDKNDTWIKNNQLITERKRLLVSTSCVFCIFTARISVFLTC